MKKQNLVSRVFAVVMAAVLLCSAGYSQNSVNINAKVNKQAVQTLIAGIQSDNEGLRRSAIYHAGFYQIEETVDALMEAFEKEDSPKNRILIALSLYTIGNEEGIEFVANASVTDRSEKVRNMCYAIGEAVQQKDTDRLTYNGQ